MLAAFVGHEAQTEMLGNGLIVERPAHRLIDQFRPFSERSVDPLLPGSWKCLQELEKIRRYRERIDRSPSLVMTEPDLRAPCKRGLRGIDAYQPPLLADKHIIPDLHQIANAVCVVIGSRFDSG